MEPLLVDIPTHKDPRGTLYVVDFPLFERVFWVSDCKEMRGNHSHLSCWQLLTPLLGTFLIITSRGGLDKREHFLTAGKSKGLLVPPGWCISYVGVDRPATLLVLATESYDKDVVIPCWEEE